MNGNIDFCSAVTGFENLYQAWMKASKGKRNKKEVGYFGLDLEEQLFQLQQELREGSYTPGPYRQFALYERKPRMISVAPFRDRVVHHAVIHVIEPLVDPIFYPHSYACRSNKGVHRAVDQYQSWAKRYCYVMKLDIRQYFPSVDHSVLKQTLSKHLPDPFIRELLGKIIDTSPALENKPVYFEGDDLFTPVERVRGLPIGNLTSQFFANLYLDGLDHFIAGTLGIHAYLRYVDDLVLLSDSKKALWQAHDNITEYLEKLRLKLHPGKTHVRRASEKVDMLGYRVSREKRWLRDDNGYRFVRKLKKMARLYAQKGIPLQDFSPSVMSWIGHACHGETEGLRQEIFSAISFKRE